MQWQVYEEMASKYFGYETGRADVTVTCVLVDEALGSVCDICLREPAIHDAPSEEFPFLLLEHIEKLANETIWHQRAGLRHVRVQC
jgi:hypothetical protein